MHINHSLLNYANVRSVCKANRIFNYGKIEKSMYACPRF